MTPWKHIRNVLIHLVSLLGIAALYRKKVRKEGPLVRVITFHDVAEKAWFDGLLDALLESCHFVTPEEFQRGAFDTKKINILITFDDGYQSWVDNVLPSLRERNIKGLFFVSSGLLNSSRDDAALFMKDRLMRTAVPALTWDGVKRLHEEGHSIGGHTAMHANLATLSDEVLRDEVKKDKDDIEAHLGTTLTQFAYPFGTGEHYTSEVKEVIRELGYTHAYTASSGFVKYRADGMLADVHEIPRLGMENVLTPRRVTEWVKGGYDIVQFLKK